MSFLMDDFPEVPSLEVDSDSESSVLLEDSFFGVIKSRPVAVNPPRVVFAATNQDDLIGDSQYFSSSYSSSVDLSEYISPREDRLADNTEESSYSFSDSHPGWHEENQDLWFIENFDQLSSSPVFSSPIKENPKSKEDILEEIRMEANELEELVRSSPIGVSPVEQEVQTSVMSSPEHGSCSEAFDVQSSSAESSPEGSQASSPAPSFFVQQHEVIYIDGQPVMSIPADRVPKSLFDGKKQALLDLNDLGRLSQSLIDQTSSSSQKKLQTKISVKDSIQGVRYNKSTNNKKSKAGRWTTSTIADPKERKKLQNREAAARYRMKKAMEKDTVMSELDVEELKNMNLRKKVLDLEQEVKYLKDLMQEIRKKNLNSSD